MTANLDMCEIVQGRTVRFLDGDEMRRGIVNGDPWAFWNGTEAILYVPVYVHDGDKCLMVNATNLVEVKTRVQPEGLSGGVASVHSSCAYRCACSKDGGPVSEGNVMLTDEQREREEELLRVARGWEKHDSVTGYLASWLVFYIEQHRRTAKAWRDSLGER